MKNKKVTQKTTKMKKEMSETKRLMERDLQINYLNIVVNRLQDTLRKNKDWIKSFSEVRDDFHEEISESICFIIEKMELDQKIPSKLKKVI